MVFTWNNDKIRWYIEANEYCGFFKNIAGVIKPMLAGYKSLCDLGCGLALFDFEISQYMETIDCVDLNAEALMSVTKRIEAQGITNMRTHLKNCNDVIGQWDVIYISFFGDLELDRFIPLCKKLIAVVNVSSETEMFPSRERGFKKNTVDQTVQYLNEKAIGHELTYRQFVFGQPFTSRKDAERFLNVYAPDITEAEISSFLDNRLIGTSNVIYPYYIPRIKSVGIFELDGSLI